MHINIRVFTRAEFTLRCKYVYIHVNTPPLTHHKYLCIHKNKLILSKYVYEMVLNVDTGVKIKIFM